MVNEGMKVSVSTLRGKVFWIRQDRLEAATQSLSNALRSTNNCRSAAFNRWEAATDARVLSQKKLYALRFSGSKNPRKPMRRRHSLFQPRQCQYRMSRAAKIPPPVACRLTGQQLSQDGIVTREFQKPMTQRSITQGIVQAYDLQLKNRNQVGRGLQATKIQAHGGRWAHRTHNSHWKCAFIHMNSG